MTPTPQMALLSARGFPFRLASALIAAVLTLISIWVYQREPRLELETVLKSVEKVETELYGRPLSQVLTVELSQSKPQKARRSSRLEIWFDPAGERFASRWSDHRSQLKHALWKPESTQELVYRADSGLVQRRVTSSMTASLMALGRDGLSLEQLERSLLRWLEERPWRPISFGRDLALYSTAEGTMVRAERLHLDRDRPIIRLSASRFSRQRRTEVVTDIDAETFRTLGITLRFTTPAQSIEVHLTVDRLEVLSPGELESKLFHPDTTVAQLNPGRSPSVQRESGIRAPAEDTLEAVSLEDLDTAEIEVWYVLHKAGVCLDSTIRVARDEAAGRIVVSGIVQTRDRRAELMEALDDLLNLPLIQLKLETADGIVAPSAVLDMAGEPTTEIRAGNLVIQDRLEKYFRERHDPMSAESPGSAYTDAVAFANEAISGSSDVIVEAWALRRLAECCGSPDLRQSRAQSRLLLAVMVEDHMQRLQNKLNSSRALLEPILSGIALDPDGSGVFIGGRAEASAAEDLGGTWSQPYTSVIRDLELMHRLVHGLFGGADLPVVVSLEAPTRLRVMSTDEAVQALLRVLYEVVPALEELEIHVAKQLTRRTNTR